MTVDHSMLTASTAIQSTYAHYIIFGCGVFGLIWGVLQIIAVSKNKTTTGAQLLTTLFHLQINKIQTDNAENKDIVNENEDEKEELAWMPWTNQDCLATMMKVNQAVKDVSTTVTFLSPYLHSVAFEVESSTCFSICSKN